jgi:amidase
MGSVHELPVGLSFMAGAYKEPELLNLAYAYEQASKKRVSPKFLKTINPQ